MSKIKRSKSENTVKVFGELWEYDVGTTFVAVWMSPKSQNFSHVYSFVMDCGSDDVVAEVRQEIERRMTLLARPLAELG